MTEYTPVLQNFIMHMLLLIVISVFTKFGLALFLPKICLEPQNYKWTT